MQPVHDMSFQIPLHFEDLTASNAGSWQVTPSTQREASSGHLLDLVNENIAPILTNGSSPTAHFNALYTLITRYQNLSENQRENLLEILVNVTKTANPKDPTHLKIALFHASGLAISACNAAPVCKFWVKSGQESLLEAMYALVTAAPFPSPFQPADLDQLASQLVRATVHVLEQPNIAKNKHIRPLLSRCLATALRLDERQFPSANTALVHAVCRHEHIASPLADVLHRVLTDHPQLDPFVAEFVREVARIPEERLVQDAAAAKSVASFMSEFVDRYPQVFVANLALVLSLLQVDAYTVRNGVVHVITVLITNEPKADDPLLHVLLQRAQCDVHAFTRSKALQCWITLTEAGLVPNRLFPVLADMAASRLEDRTAAVRKYAAQLLVALLKCNPFGPALKRSLFVTKLDEICSVFPDEDEQDAANETDNSMEKNDEDGDSARDTSSSEENLEENADANDVDKENSNESDSQGENDSNEDENMHEGGNATEENEANENDEQKAPSAEEREAMLKKKFYKSGVEYISSLENSLQTMYSMLRSKSITDVAEAVSLLVTVVQFQLEAASGGAVRKMLPLLLARETNTREKAIDAYVRLLVPGGIDTVDEKEAAMTVVKGLIALVVGATLGEIACLEELINALGASREDCRAITPAVISVMWDLFSGKVPRTSMEQRRAAGMLVAMVAVKHPTSVVERVDILSQIGLKDPAFARWSCVALCHMPSGSHGSNQLCSQLIDLCITADDLSIVEQSINAIFALSNEPEAIMEGIICTLGKDLHSHRSNVGVRGLSRFLIVIGHTAVKELVRIEQLTSIVKKVKTGAQSDENQEQEEKEGAEAEKALEEGQKELLSPKLLLYRYGEIALSVANDMKNAPEELRASAVLCLAKLMCVQEDFCKKNLRFLFSILANEEGPPGIRANAVISLGDLTVRFPNLIEPWSGYIYKSLSDASGKVRKNTLLVLTHLILNDMIKVKGQIVEMAICINDSDERIADLALLFFHELARKSANAIYNILPDTISCMSKMGERRLNPEDFKKVIGFLMGLMDKEKHADGMVEKLCHRFRTSTNERENRDLAYCISQLNISAKGLQKLSESFKSYSAAIVDDEVYESILHAVTKGAKSAGSGNNATVCEELTSKMEAVRRAGEGENESEMTQRTVITRRTSTRLKLEEQTSAKEAKPKISTRKKLSEPIEVDDDGSDESISPKISQRRRR